MAVLFFYFNKRDDGMDEVISICKLAIECIVNGNYGVLKEKNALTRVAAQDIQRVLSEYNPDMMPVMPPDDYFEQAPYIGEYRDGSGWYVDIDLWYPSGQSDLTLQLDIRKNQSQLAFIIDDIRVM